ncbi:MAG: hypothetical protein WKG01_04630 [Kofleriaceae bacterium]
MSESLPEAVSQADQRHPRYLSRSSLFASLATGPWRRLVSADVTGFDPAAADLTVTQELAIEETPLPALHVAAGMLTEDAAVAADLVASIEQRQDLLRKAGQLAVAAHADYLRGTGPRGPLLDDATIRAATGHSRDELAALTEGKWIATPRGRIELRGLFAVPADPIKDAIATLVGAEPPVDPLSDDTILEMLATEDFKLPRLPGEDHPVATLRRSLGIPDASERKKT